MRQRIQGVKRHGYNHDVAMRQRIRGVNATDTITGSLRDNIQPSLTRRGSFRSHFRRVNATATITMSLCDKESKRSFRSHFRGVNATATITMSLCDKKSVGDDESWSRQRLHDKMANTYSHCYNHIVFSTKNRIDLIDPQIEKRVWAYIGGIARKHGMTALQVGGIDNHVHALVSSPPSMAPSKIAQYLKGDSSYWIHREFQEMNKFAWQDGYGVFSVCKSHAPKVIDYIRDQRLHHEKQTFEEEYVDLLKLHEIDYDERYLFG